MTTPLTTHNIQLYEMGGGIVWLKNYTSGSYFDLGNCPDFRFAVKETAIEKKEWQVDRLVVKHRVVTETGVDLQFKLDELSIVNLALWSMGTVVGNVIHGLEALSNEYALKFVSDNQSGENHTAEFWRVRLEGSGDLSEISINSFKGLGLRAIVLDDRSHHPKPDSAYFNITKN